jgi:hypothetical protein
MKRLIITLLTLSVLILAQDFKYVGTTSCKMCHNKEVKGAQFSKWEDSRHANAFETLKSEQSAQIAAEKGIECNPWKAPECIKCHTTGYSNGGYEVMEDSFWNPAADDRAGAKAVKRMKGLQAVGCEACHGAGSKYKSSKTMKAIYSGEVDDTTVGLAQISEETCKTCHNEESPTFKSFNYEEMLQKVAHPMPVN